LNSPQFPDNAVDIGKIAIKSWYRFVPIKAHSLSLPPDIMNRTGSSISKVTTSGKNLSDEAAKKR
jgi:hypothetical protein